MLFLCYNFFTCLLYTSILAAYGKEIDQSVISDYKEISGYGISVMAGEDVYKRQSYCCPYCLIANMTNMQR